MNSWETENAKRTREHNGFGHTVVLNTYLDSSSVAPQELQVLRFEVASLFGPQPEEACEFDEHPHLRGASTGTKSDIEKLTRTNKISIKQHHCLEHTQTCASRTVLKLFAFFMQQC